jgi:hypothetical protein
VIIIIPTVIIYYQDKKMIRFSLNFLLKDLEVTLNRLPIEN